MTEVDGGADLAALVAERATRQGARVAVIESLTGGLLASELARAEGAGSWFRGGIVAYASEVKHDLLDVPAVSVVSREAAVAMARRGAELLGAEVAVAVTGVGGPDAQDGVPAGTVWVAVADAGGVEAQLHHFDGGPEEVCAATSRSALALLAERLAEAPSAQLPR